MSETNQQTEIIASAKRFTYPSIVLNKAIVFPGEQVSLVLEGEGTIKTVESALNENHMIVLLFQDRGRKSSVGIVARILQSWRLASHIMGMTVGGIERVCVVKSFSEEGIQKVEITELAHPAKKEEEKTKLEAISRSVHHRFRELLQMRGTVPPMVLEELQKAHLSAERMSDVVSAALPFNFQEKLTILETLDVYKRLEMLNSKLAKEFEVMEAEKKIDEEVAKEMGKTQRDYILRERLKAIEKELGIEEERKE